MKNLRIIFFALFLSNNAFGQVSDTLALDFSLNSCGSASFNALFYFANEDSVQIHVDFGNNTDTTILFESNFSDFQITSSYAYSGNYTVAITAETVSGTLLDQKTYNFPIAGGEECAGEMIYKIRNNFSGPYFQDTIPIDFTGSDGITHVIYPDSNNLNHYSTNPLLYPAQIRVNAAWLAAHSSIQLNPTLYFSQPTITESYFYEGWPTLIISRTDLSNENNAMFLQHPNDYITDSSPTTVYLNLNNTLGAIPDSINRIRVEYDPFLLVSHDTLGNSTEGNGFIEFDVERLNLYQSIPFGITASNMQSLDSIYFRCFYLNNTDQNAPDDTTTIYLEIVDPCYGMTDSVLNISLNSVITQYGNQVTSLLTLSKNQCSEIDSIGLTIHHSPSLHLNQTPGLAFSEVNDSTLYILSTIHQYASSQSYSIDFTLNTITSETVYVNYSINITDGNLSDNNTGDSLNFLLCDSTDYSIMSFSASMVAPTQSGMCYISPINLVPCLLSDTAEIQITFPGYVTMDSSSLALGTFADSTFHLRVDWSNQSNYILIPFHIPGNIPGGTPYSIKAEIIAANDITPSNNEILFSGIVLNSYDPNEKQSDLPSSLNPEVQEKITYTIHFQNDGNLEAYNIVVRDTISPNLDLSTFRFLGASHQCEVTLDETTREVLFSFHQIMLPSSTWDSLGSQGIFSYQISESAELPLGSVIENTAYIYFDFNPAITTNTTYHINETSLGSNEMETEPIRMYPNPAKDRIQFRGATINSVLIYDLTGKLAFVTQSVLNNEISTNLLQDGIYQVVLTTEQGTSIHQLVIKK